MAARKSSVRVSKAKGRIVVSFPASAAKKIMGMAARKKPAKKAVCSNAAKRSRRPARRRRSR